MGLRADLASLPPREQAWRLAIIVQPLLAKIVLTEPDARDGEAVLAAIRAWGEGERLTGRSFSDLIYDDAERGTLRRLSAAAGKPSEGAWNALTTAAMYVAWLVIRETGEPMPSDVNEVDEGTLDLLEEQLGALG
jgi:hypothetical protein